MRPGQAIEVRDIGNFEADYKSLRAILTPLLDGGDLEHVTVLASFDGKEPLGRMDMFFDETSEIKELPRNEFATKLYRQAAMMGRRPGVKPPKDPDELPAIYGPAVLFESRVWR